MSDQPGVGFSLSLSQIRSAKVLRSTWPPHLFIFVLEAAKVQKSHKGVHRKARACRLIVLRNFMEAQLASSACCEGVIAKGMMLAAVHHCWSKTSSSPWSRTAEAKDEENMHVFSGHGDGDGALLDHVFKFAGSNVSFNLRLDTTGDGLRACRLKAQQMHSALRQRKFRRWSSLIEGENVA